MQNYRFKLSKSFELHLYFCFKGQLKIIQEHLPKSSLLVDIKFICYKKYISFAINHNGGGDEARHKNFPYMHATLHITVYGKQKRIIQQRTQHYFRLFTGLPSEMKQNLDKSFTEDTQHVAPSCFLPSEKILSNLRDIGFKFSDCSSDLQNIEAIAKEEKEFYEDKELEKLMKKSHSKEIFLKKRDTILIIGGHFFLMPGHGKHRNISLPTIKMLCLFNIIDLFIFTKQVRNIMEGVVVLHETIHELRRKKDCGKAYDKIKWPFVQQTLRMKVTTGGHVGIK
ncbi:hypothetical protein ACJX0J_039083, partial [Zea mays]